jgi:hypothetical protein
MANPPVPRHARPPSRLACALGLIRLALFLVFHRHASLPAGLLNVRVPDAPRGVRLTLLDEIAAGYRTTVVKRFGSLVAERRFGPLTVEAHLKDEDYSAQLAAGMTARTATASGAAA